MYHDSKKDYDSESMYHGSKKDYASESMYHTSKKDYVSAPVYHDSKKATTLLSLCTIAQKKRLRLWVYVPWLKKGDYAPESMYHSFPKQSDYASESTTNHLTPTTYNQPPNTNQLPTAYHWFYQWWEVVGGCWFLIVQKPWRTLRRFCQHFFA